MIGLPSLRDLDGASGTRIWLAAEPTDMRCGFDRLAEQVRSVISQGPLSGHLFLFRSRRAERLKVLTWDRDGYVLWYKRLEQGTFRFPTIAGDGDGFEIRAVDLTMILDGVDLDSVKRQRRYRRPEAAKPEPTS